MWVPKASGHFSYKSSYWCDNNNRFNEIDPLTYNKYIMPTKIVSSSRFEVNTNLMSLESPRPDLVVYQPTRLMVPLPTTIEAHE